MISRASDCPPVYRNFSSGTHLSLAINHQTPQTNNNMQHNINAVLNDMPAIPSPPQELAAFVNDLIDVGEPRMAIDNIDPGVQSLVLQEALLEEQARQLQIVEDAALADLLQDVSEEEDSGFESDIVEEEEVQAEEEAMEVDSDAETVNNNSSDDAGDSSDSPHNNSDLDNDEVTLRRVMCVRQRFFRSVQHLLRLQRNEEMVRMRRRLRGIHRRIKRRRDEVHDVPHCYRDMCFGCAKRFWCQRNRRWIRCTACGFWLCPNCNEEPVHCQNEKQFLP